MPLSHEKQEVKKDIRDNDNPVLKKPHGQCPEKITSGNEKKKLKVFTQNLVSMAVIAFLGSACVQLSNTSTSTTKTHEKTNSHDKEVSQQLNDVLNTLETVPEASTKEAKQNSATRRLRQNRSNVSYVSEQAIDQTIRAKAAKTTEQLPGELLENDSNDATSDTPNQSTRKRKNIAPEFRLNLKELSNDGKNIEYHIVGEPGKPGLSFKLASGSKISTARRAFALVIGGGSSHLEIRLAKSQATTVEAMAKRGVRAHKRTKNYVSNGDVLRSIRIGVDQKIACLSEDFNNESKSGRQYHQKHYYFGVDGYCYKVLSFSTEKADAKIEALCNSLLASLRFDNSG